MTVSFADLKAMLAAKPLAARTTPAACDAALAAMQHDGVALTGDWIDIVKRLAALQQKDWPALHHPRVALYAANYGQDLGAVQSRLATLAAQKDPLTRLCAQVNADLRVYELDLSLQVPADGLGEEDAAHAMSYGLMAVEEHVDCLIPEIISLGATEVMTRWHAEMLKENGAEPLEALRQAGAGADLFALLGGVAAAYMAGIPVFAGARLAPVLAVALERLLPGAGGNHVCIGTPSMLVASDAVQAIAGLKQLQLILALGPQHEASGKTVQLKAAVKASQGNARS